MSCGTFYNLWLTCELCYILHFRVELWIVLHILQFMINLWVVVRIMIHIYIYGTYYKLWLSCDLCYILHFMINLWNVLQKRSRDILWKELEIARHTLLPTTLISCCQSKPQPALHLITPPPLLQVNGYTQIW